MGLRHNRPTPQGAAVVAVAPPWRRQRMEKPPLVRWSRRNRHTTQRWCVRGSGERLKDLEMVVVAHEGSCHDGSGGVWKVAGGQKMALATRMRERTRESIDETSPSDAIAPDLPITDSLVMKDEHLDTIPELDFDNESSVKNLNLTLCESEDLFDYVSECDFPLCDNSLDFNNDYGIFSNHLFVSKDDYTSSDDESSSEEDVLVEHFKICSNPFLEFNEEIFSSEINPLYNEVLKDLDPNPPGNENDHFNAESD
nr:hypothetical protein [Tanacetum cinerariifolium]